MIDQPRLRRSRHGVVRVVPLRHLPMLFVILSLFVGGVVATPCAAQPDQLANARALVDKGDFAGAAALLEQLATGGESGPAWQRLAGRVAMGQGKPTRAVEHFTRVADTAAATALDLRNLAWAQFETAATVGDRMLQRAGYADAAATARRATEKDPAFRSGWEYRVAALDQLGDTDQTLAAIRDAAAALNASPADRAGFAMFAADYRRRLESVETAVESIRALPAETPARAATIARLWRDAGRVDKATTVLADALNNNPDDQAALQVCWETFGSAPGSALDDTTRRRAEAGIALLAKVTAAHPKAVFARAYLGNLHSSLAAFDDAERAYRQCLEIDPTYTYAYQALGNLYRDRADKRMKDPKHDRDLVRADFARAVDTWLDYYEKAAASNSIDENTIARVDFLIYEQSRVALDPARAYDAYKKFRGRFPGRYNVEHTYSLICQDVGKFEEALEAMKASIAGCPDPALKARYINNRGLLFEAWKRYDEAKASFEEAAKMTGLGRLDGLENLGKLHYKLGSYQKARDRFYQVLQSAPDRTSSIFYYHLCRRRIEREAFFRLR